MWILILAVLFTDDGDGRIHLMLGGFVCFTPLFPPESAGFRQDVVSFKIPGEVFVKQGEVLG